MQTIMVRFPVFQLSVGPVVCYTSSEAFLGKISFPIDTTLHEMSLGMLNLTSKISKISQFPPQKTLDTNKKKSIISKPHPRSVPCTNLAKLLYN